MHQSYDDGFSAVVDVGAAVECLANGMGFTEGPVWVPRLDSVLFTDLTHNSIMSWSSRSGLEVWDERAHFPIGLTLDDQQRLISCQHSSRRVVRYELDGTVTVLADRLDGRLLNSPNDVIVTRDGVVLFTDPNFGVRLDDAGALVFYQVGMEQPSCSVLRVTDDPTSPAIVTDAIYRPNGLCLSPDESVLYVSDTSDSTHHIWRMSFDGGSVTGLERFAEMPRGVPDGMRVDVDGRLFACGLDGVYVWDADGVLLGTIAIPEMPANCCFGGPDLRTLYVTATSSLYRVDLRTAGAR